MYLSRAGMVASIDEYLMALRQRYTTSTGLLKASLEENDMVLINGGCGADRQCNCMSPPWSGWHAVVKMAKGWMNVEIGDRQCVETPQTLGER